MSPEAGPPLPLSRSVRKRKSHTKSRSGCGNCKIRRCDEAKPDCRRCVDFGVSCNFGRRSAVTPTDLQASITGAFQLEMPQKPLLSQTILGLVNTTLAQNHPTPTTTAAAVYQLKNADLHLFSKFCSRTILTLGTANTRPLYQKETIRLASLHSFLMHIVLALTMMHDRYMSASPPPPQSTAELYHWYQGTSMFKNKLSGPLTSSERDAIWIACVLLGSTTLANIEAATAEEAWPLKEPSPSDLDWVRMTDGKKVVWQIADLSRPDSTLRSLAFAPNLRACWSDDNPSGRFESLPTELVELATAQADGQDGHAANPYVPMMRILNYLMTIKCDDTTFLRYFGFLSQMQPEFRDLLQRKDPCALVMLAYWYAKVCNYHVWIIWRRAILECQATCLYLERYHSDFPNLGNVLLFPKKACGLVRE